MLTADFDYDLPAERIAQHPAPRGESRLFCPDRVGAARHLRIGDLPGLLRTGDLLVVNDTRVIPARLLARRVAGGGRVELLLVRKMADRDWQALARPARRARPGTRLELPGGIEATVTGRGEDGIHHVRFSAPLEPLLDEIGHVPLPPYIKRPDEAADRERYQTVYARAGASIAAPTAGLHFTAGLLERIRGRGIEVTEVRLEVGIGTFKPVHAELVHEHRMDAERYEVPDEAAAAVAAARGRGGRVVAVGTTVVRTLEAVAAIGQGTIRAGSGTTDLFITPGFRFRVVDVLLTNFHLPRSTLLMLVCAFWGRERMLAAYREAIEAGYRFYSYGDAMLLERDRSGAG